MGFLDEVWSGVKAPFEFVYDHAIKPVVNRFDLIGGVIDKGVVAGGNVIQAAGGAATGILGGIEGLSSLLSNPMGIVIAITAAVVVVKLITK